jgi:hypothetical protein
MSKDFMVKQLTQLFTYAELQKRLYDCKELLDPENGYYGEGKVYKAIDDLQEIIRQNMEQHLSNSNVSKRAMTIVNNTVILGNRKLNKENKR